MRIFNKISKGGIFCDKRFEHFTLLHLVKNGEFEEYEQFGETDFEVQFFEAVIRVDVADYADGIVRLIGYVGSVEVGRLLVGRGDFINNIKFLQKGGK